jgi:hypothetical protein
VVPVTKPSSEGRGLALGQSVDLVVVDQVGDFGVAPHGMDKVVAALGVAVPVPALGDDLQAVVGQPDAGGHGQGPPVQTVEQVAFQVMRQLGGLADARGEHHLVGRDVQ